MNLLELSIQFCLFSMIKLSTFVILFEEFFIFVQYVGIHKDAFFFFTLLQYVKTVFIKYKALIAVCL